MKHILTLSLCFLALSLSAQTDGWEYPFPYNPDGNADGYIALADLMDLLALYGQEYPDSFYGDNNGAILNLGQMTYSKCHRTTRDMGPQWRIMDTNDFHNWFEYLLEDGQSRFELASGSLSEHGWVKMNDGDNGYYVLNFNPSQTAIVDGIEYNLQNSLIYNFLTSNDDDGYNGQLDILNSKTCYAITEVRPAIEYKCIDIAYSDYEAEANLLIEQGYLPIGGPANHGGANKYFGCFWRWAE
jgi:hypothetical protein